MPHTAETPVGTTGFEIGLLKGSLAELSKAVRILAGLAVCAPLANIGVVFWTTDRMTDTLRHEMALQRESTVKELKSIKATLAKVKKLQDDEQAMREALGALGVDSLKTVPAAR